MNVSCPLCKTTFPIMNTVQFSSVNGSKEGDNEIYLKKKKELQYLTFNMISAEILRRFAPSPSSTYLPLRCPLIQTGLAKRILESYWGDADQLDHVPQL